ncbi:MAG TPA: hypothetical protein DCP92_23705 [Nitrospiraceae bacterium]|nr:hypothetical protein [Nitrospiraceae bacterium]
MFFANLRKIAVGYRGKLGRAVTMTINSEPMIDSRRNQKEDQYHPSRRKASMHCGVDAAFFAKKS